MPKEQETEFANFVEYAVKRYGVITPAEAEEWLTNGVPDRVRSARRLPLLFSFDDGFRSNFNIAAPILERNGVRAIFFISPGLTDMASGMQLEAVANFIFDRRVSAGQLSTEKRLMSWDEITELRRRGHTIGCHGMTHQRLSLLDDDALFEEIVEAGDRLDSILEQETDWYAYAFGDIDSIDSRALAIISKRYRYCRSGLRGANTTQTLSMALTADALSLEAPSSYLRLLCEGGLDLVYYFKRRRLVKMVQVI